MTSRLAALEAEAKRIRDEAEREADDLLREATRLRRSQKGAAIFSIASLYSDAGLPPDAPDVRDAVLKTYRLNREEWQRIVWGWEK